MKGIEPATKHHKLLSHGSVILQHRSQGPFSLNFISTKMTIKIPQADIQQNYRKRGEIYTHVHMKIVLVLPRELLKVQFVKYSSNLSINHKTCLPSTGHPTEC